ncbi:hypothetical protein [Terrabacter sp. Ter38]|uniref:hypothetical protein n=1 Tax=Terrabacter sp. Ter38 TaxID=2926030 RepID=UPI0021180FAE|nr:hypothetical protein [Terrabacter sp. Ter38]
MTSTLLSIQNPPDGLLEIVLDRDDSVAVRLMWPFDRSENDWIRLNDRFDLGEFTHAVQALGQAGSDSHVTSAASELQLVRHDNTFTFDLARTIPQSKRAILDFPIHHLLELQIELDALGEKK